MQLQTVEKFESISPQDFKRNYYKLKKPVVIKGLVKQWAGYHNWNWDYFIEALGEKQVDVFNNIKSDACTPVNSADGYIKFGDYLR